MTENQQDNPNTLKKVINCSIPGQKLYPYLSYCTEHTAGGVKTALGERVKVFESRRGNEAMCGSADCDNCTERVVIRIREPRHIRRLIDTDKLGQSLDLEI